VAHPGPAGGLDGVAVLGHARAEVVEGDQEQPLDAGERRGGARDVVHVDGGGAQPALGERGEALGVAAEGQDAVRGHAPLEQGVDGEAAELAGGADDRDGHAFSSYPDRHGDGGCSWSRSAGTVPDARARTARPG